jgi:hypothetical protein
MACLGPFKLWHSCGKPIETEDRSLSEGGLGKNLSL